MVATFRTSKNPRCPFLPPLVAVVLTLILVTGCRQASRRDASPTLLTPTLSAPSTQEAAPFPNDSGAPAMPPAEEPSLPPLPGTAEVARDVEPIQLGGFTPPRSFSDAPQLPVPDAEENHDESLLSILPAASDDDVSTDLPLNELADNADDAQDSLGASEAVPLRSFLRTPTAQPVELDASLFLLELQADALNEPKSKVNVVQLPPAAMEVPVPRSVEIVDDIPQPEPTTSPKAWPAQGVPLEIVITPGPIVPKWSPNPTYPAYAAPPAAMPRRLATSNSDWDLRPIE